MSSIKWHLGHVVHNLRNDRHWTQTQLAKKAGLNKATVVSVEKMDRNHGRGTYEALAGAFGMTLADLYALVPRETQRPATGETPTPSPTGTAGRKF